MNFSDASKTNGHAPEQTQAIPHQTASIAIPDDQSVGQALARAEKQIQFRKGIVKLIAANIDERDIQLFGNGDNESLWLAKNACKQILSWAGARVEPDSIIQEKEYQGVEGKYIDFEVWATILTSDGRAVRTMGNRSTYDDFYAKRVRYTCPQCKSMTDYDRGCPQHGKVRGIKEDYYLPLSEVDIPAIKQAAITNMWNHAVQDMGLMPTLDDLRIAGLDLKAQKRVDFKSNKQNSTQAPAGGVTPQAAPAAATQSHQPATRTAGTTSPSTAPAVPPSQKVDLPKAVIPGAPEKKQATPAKNGAMPLGKGIVSLVVPKVTQPKENKEGKLVGGGNPFLEVHQNGNFLYCFKASEIETVDGPRKIFELIGESVGRFCDFTIETSKKESKKPLHSIVGAMCIGRYAWDEQGQPAMPSISQLPDEDIPF